MTTFKDEVQKLAVIEIMEKNDIFILAIQETECLHQSKEQWFVSLSGKKYLFVHTGYQKGVGFLVSSSAGPISAENFEEISPRILKLSIRNEIFFSVYAPTDQKDGSQKSWKNQKFFSSLNKALEAIKK